MKTGKVGALVRCYGSTQYLSAVLKHLKGIVDRVLVANIRFDGVAETVDNTKEIAESLGVEVWTKDGLPRHGACNAGIERLDDCDYVFYNDADEFVRHEDMKAMLDGMVATNKTVGMLSVVDYASLTTAYTQRTHKPHYLIKHGTRAFMERCFDGENFVLDGDMHHFGYMLNKNTTDWKLKNLWYDNRSDYDRVVCSQIRNVDMPIEILNMVKECV